MTRLAAPLRQGTLDDELPELEHGESAFLSVGAVHHGKDCVTTPA